MQGMVGRRRRRSDRCGTREKPGGSGTTPTPLQPHLRAHKTPHPPQIASFPERPGVDDRQACLACHDRRAQGTSRGQQQIGNPSSRAWSKGRSSTSAASQQCRSPRRTPGEISSAALSTPPLPLARTQGYPWRRMRRGVVTECPMRFGSARVSQAKVAYATRRHLDVRRSDARVTLIGHDDNQ